MDKHEPARQFQATTLLNFRQMAAPDSERGRLLAGGLIGAACAYYAEAHGPAALIEFLRLRADMSEAPLLHAQARERGHRGPAHG